MRQENKAITVIKLIYLQSMAQPMPQLLIFLVLGIYLKNVAYGDISNYLSLRAWNNWIVITTPWPNFSVVGVWGADLRGLGGNSAVVFASGFLNPSGNQNGEAFGLFVALADGNVVELPQLYGDEAQNSVNKVMNENGEELSTVTSYGLEQNLSESI